jgi:hypothetical protein
MADMYLTNDYGQQVLPDQRVRDVARLAEHNRRDRPAPSNRVRWCRRLLARARQRIGTAASVVRHSVELRCPSAGPRDERDPVRVEICRTGWVADL